MLHKCGFALCSSGALRAGESCLPRDNGGLRADGMAKRSVECLLLKKAAVYLKIRSQKLEDRSQAPFIVIPEVC